MAKLTQDERDEYEDAIVDAHMAAEKYLETGKDVHLKLLEVSVTEALQYTEVLKDLLVEDEKTEAYKLHLMIPLQLMKLIELRKGNSNAT